MDGQDAAEADAAARRAGGQGREGRERRQEGRVRQCGRLGPGAVRGCVLVALLFPLLLVELSFSQAEIDRAALLCAGKAPFKASYTLQKGSHHGDTRSHHLQAIQPRADLTLFTASPGRHTYTFTGVGDSLYTSPGAAGLEAPVGGKDGVVRIEQDVWALPTAGFAHGAKHGFCVHDKLASRGHDDLVLRLEGQAPFEVELEVREDGHRASKRFTVPAIQAHDWPVSLSYGLNTAAPHSILLRRVKDAHGCETLVDPSSSSSSSAAGASALKASVSIPVAEIATITPVSAQVDHCVGDALEFIVQGSPPFTVKYEFEGKQHAVAHSSGTFQRLAAAPGTFKVLSVGHGEDQCRSNQVDMCVARSLHALPPSARLTPVRLLFAHPQRQVRPPYPLGSSPDRRLVRRRHPRGRADRDQVQLLRHAALRLHLRSSRSSRPQQGPHGPRAAHRHVRRPPSPLSRTPRELAR